MHFQKSTQFFFIAIRFDLTRVALRLSQMNTEEKKRRTIILTNSHVNSGKTFSKNLILNTVTLPVARFLAN